MSEVSLDWSAAEVKSSKLTVPLEGDLTKDWRQSFEATVMLLGGGEWGEIQLRRGTIEVSDVEAGSEGKLRHHLEAVVTQANADLEPEESEDNEAPDADESESGAEQEDDGPDAEMTRRFRSL